MEFSPHREQEQLSIRLLYRSGRRRRGHGRKCLLLHPCGAERLSNGPRGARRWRGKLASAHNKITMSS